MITSLRSLRFAAAACGLALLFSVAPVATRPVLADDVDDAVAELKALAKAGEEGKCIAKMVELESNYDERVNKALYDLTKSKHEKIAKTAIARLATRKDKSLHKGLKKKLGDKKLAKKSPEIYMAYLDAAGEYRDPKLLKPLEDVVKKYLPMNADFSTRAIYSYGTVREKKVVDQMLKWLEQVDTLGGGGQGGGGGKGLSTETRDNYDKAKNALVKALAELTGQEIGDAKTWRDWWDKRAKKFEFPDPDAPEVDPATLKEWTDQAYGYTVKLPTNGEGWSFTKPEGAIRMRLMNKDEQMEYVRGEFMLHNTSSNTPKTLGELVKWYTDTELPNRFRNMAKGPDIEERKIGAREWTIITAKGDCGGRYKGWGSAENRIYLHQIDHIILRIEGVARLGAEDYQKAGLWEALENLGWDD